ncbi:MAG: hypothetical protein AAFR26_24815 [Cyanobacteria bacterium J06626_4]
MASEQLKSNCTVMVEWGLPTKTQLWVVGMSNCVGDEAAIVGNAIPF